MAPIQALRPLIQGITGLSLQVPLSRISLNKPSKFLLMSLSTTTTLFWYYYYTFEWSEKSQFWKCSVNICRCNGWRQYLSFNTFLPHFGWRKCLVLFLALPDISASNWIGLLFDILVSSWVSGIFPSTQAYEWWAHLSLAEGPVFLCDTCFTILGLELPFSDERHGSTFWLAKAIQQLLQF